MIRAKITKPELLSPAGGWSALLSAVDNGADSVYFGVKGMTMRAAAGNFEQLEIRKVMQFLHLKGKKGYLALNTIVMQDQLKNAEQILRRARESQVDAVILWDLGLIDLARQIGLPVHISTQASVANARAVEFYHGQGVKRIVLARECTLEQIHAIRRQLTKQRSECELEVFVHGAMCLSISGRCFMSAYTHGQSANQGKCTQPCRREYEIRAIGGREHFVVGRDHVMSPKDLSTLGFIDDLIESGVHSFKIEGRMRSPEYAAAVTSAYRHAIDAYYEKKLNAALKENLQQGLKAVYNRGFSSGFYFGEPDGEKSRGFEHTHEKIFIGDVRKYYKNIMVADVLVRNEGLQKGERIVVFGDRTPAAYATVLEMQYQHQAVDRAGKGDRIGLKVPFEVRKGDKVFLWKKKAAVGDAGSNEDDSF